MPPIEQNMPAKSLAVKTIFFVTVLTLIVLSLGIYFGLRIFKSKPQLSSTEFSGVVSFAKDNYVLVKGNYIVDGKIYKEAGRDSRDVEVFFLTGDTKLNSTVVHSPTIDELRKSNGKWDMSAVKKEVVPGSSADMTAGLIVHIRTDANIFGQSKLNAKVIDYSILTINPTTTEATTTHGICDDAKGKYIGAEACLKKTNLKSK